MSGIIIVDFINIKPTFISVIIFMVIYHSYHNYIIFGTICQVLC